MEDINAAVEDAEYVRAMRDSVPQPTKDWDWMAASDLAKYIEQKERTNPKLFQLETVTSSALGLYLVRGYNASLLWVRSHLCEQSMYSAVYKVRQGQQFNGPWKLCSSCRCIKVGTFLCVKIRGFALTP